MQIAYSPGCAVLLPDGVTGSAEYPAVVGGDKAEGGHLLASELFIGLK